MNSTPSTASDPRWLVQSAAGVVALSALLAPAVAESKIIKPEDVTFTRSVTPDTHHAATIRVGLLRDDISTLISKSAKAAIGASGIKRLENFLRLQAGWDGPASKPVNLQSVDVFSRFFEDTALHPDRLGVFMSAQGNLVVNWTDEDGELIELEFLPAGIEYFSERSGEERFVPASDAGIGSLHSKISGTVEA